MSAEPKNEEVKAEEVTAKEVVKDEVKEEKKEDEEMKEVAEKNEDEDMKEQPDGEAQEEVVEEEEAKPKEPEKPKELEADAAEDTRSKVSAGTVEVSTTDTTMNALPTAGNKLLMSLTDGGFQYLLAGIRATAGIKAGRYMVEAKIVEMQKGGDQSGAARDKVPQPRNLFRIGLSTSGSSLILGDAGPDSLCFDSEGAFIHEKIRKKTVAKFGRDSTIAMLVNLDESSPNANTVSLFKDGVRICQPQAIPEKMRGKTLYPTITYRNVTVQVNFGPQPLAPLPFTCRMLGDAAQADVELAPAPQPKDGKYEVLFPVGLPDTGYFDWVDAFVEKNPDYVELSDRKIIDWAVKSGMWKPKAAGHSNDKPDMKFGIPSMDDLSVSRLLKHIAPVTKRNFIVPELKANLSDSERKKALLRFAPPEFKKVACVVMGEPTAEYKARVHEVILSEKKRKAEGEKKKKAAEEERKRLIEAKQKKAEEARKANKRKRDGEAEEETKEEEPEEKPAEETKADEEVVVELTEVEKALKCRQTPMPDITETILAKSYANFSLPSVAEGFDAVTFAWQSEAECATLMKDWIFAKKLTQRVEDLKTGDSFKEAWSAWQKQLAEWRKLASEWKDPNKRKALLAKRAEAKKKVAEEKGDEAPKEENEVEIDLEELDVFAVEDINDIGNGMPLFADYVFEDWTLLSARYEMHLLLHSFKKDLNDPDRPSFTEKDLSFYYNKYFKKTFNLKGFGVEKLDGLQDMIKDTFSINAKTGFLEAALSDDTPTTNFVKLTEDHRRERVRRLDAGDETAELKFPRNSPAPPQRNPPGRSGAWTGGAGGSKGGSGKGGSGKGGGGKGGGGSHAVGSRQPPPSAPPARYGSQSSYSAGAGARAGGGGGYQSGATAQKRAYTPTGASSYSAAKQPRTSSYGSGGGGGGGGGGYGGGGGGKGGGSKGGGAGGGYYGRR